MELTQEQTDKYNREIADFCHSVHNMSFDTDWTLLMEAYQELCKKVNYQFCVIERDRVWSDGRINLPFQQALFYVVGKTCEEYNKQQNENNIKANS